MIRINKYLMLSQFLLLNIIGQNIIQSAARIQTKEPTAIDLELMKAIVFKNKNKIKELITQGANVNAANKIGWTALGLASVDGDKEIVELLINPYTDINIANNLGNTALGLAALYGHKEVVKLLLLSGANIDSKNNLGETVIDLAKKKNKFEFEIEIITKNKQDVVKILEDEPARRSEVINKWIKEKLSEKITESTYGILIPDISNLIWQYVIEYTDIPLEYRLNN